MNKLKRKMFFTLFLVLLMLAGVLTFFMDYREYSDQRDTLQRQMVKVSGAFEGGRNLDAYSVYYKDADEDGMSHEGKESTDDEPHLFMLSEFPIYTVFLNRNRDVQRIAYFNTDGDDWEDVMETAQKVAALHSPGQMHIGNLFHDHYAWYYGLPNIITVVDIEKINDEMVKMLLFSIPVFLLEGLLMYAISRRLTNWMIQPIEQTFEKQKQFIADASHELKTPLAVIMASADAMERDGDSKWLKNIEFESDRMNALIKSLLDLTRSEQNELTLEKVDLSFLAEKEIMIQEAVMFEKGIELEEQIPEDICVWGQSTSIEKVLEILLDNALSHAKSKILVRLEKKGKEAILRIENNGDTIPAEEREKIFERFYRSDSARNRKENRYGLGLAIARNLMQQMGGTIGVDEQNGLTSFYIKLKLFASKNAAEHHQGIS